MMGKDTFRSYRVSLIERLEERVKELRADRDALHESGVVPAAMTFARAWRVLHSAGAVSAGRKANALSRIQEARARLLGAAGEVERGGGEG